jgi:hypothetical protein
MWVPVLMLVFLYSTINSTSGSSDLDSAHGPGLFTLLKSPTVEVPQDVNLNRFCDGPVHLSYREYGLSLTRLALH